MFFCLKTNVNLPSTCPILNNINKTLNCSEGYLFKFKTKKQIFSFFL